MKLRLNKYNVQIAIIYCLLLLASMNFRGKFFYFAAAAFVVVALSKRQIKCSRDIIVYFLLSLVMLAYDHQDGIHSVLWCASFTFMYLMGYSLIQREKNEVTDITATFSCVEKRSYILLSVISIGTFMHFVLNFIANFGSEIGRNTIDIWTGQSMAATGQVAFACLMLALSIAMILAPPAPICRIIGFVCILVMLAYNLMLAGRTLVVMIFFIFCVGFVFTHGNPRRIHKKRKFGVAFWTLVLGCVLAFALNLGEIREYILGSNLYERFIDSDFSVTTDSRFSAKKAYLLNAYFYPFGGLHLRNKYGYAHDLLLDGYDEFGIFGFLFLLIILIGGILGMLWFIKKSNYNIELKTAALCIYLSFIMLFCMEPILDGMSWLFALFCFVNGLIAGVNRKTKE